MISFIYMGKAFLQFLSGMTDGSGTTHRKCRGAQIVRLMPTVWAH